MIMLKYQYKSTSVAAFELPLTTAVRASVGDETFLTGIGVLKTTWYIFLNIILQISGVGTPSD